MVAPAASGQRQVAGAPAPSPRQGSQSIDICYSIIEVTRLLEGLVSSMHFARTRSWIGARSVSGGNTIRVSGARFLVLAVLATLVAAQFGTAAAQPSAGPSRSVLNVLDEPFNAVGDGETNDGPAIQQALNAAEQKPGSTVLLPAGQVFVAAGLVVGDHTTLKIDGTLKQSQRPEDYDYQPLLGHFLDPGENIDCDVEGTPATSMSGTCGIDDGFFHNRPLVHAQNSEGVTITGRGSIVMTDTKVDGEYDDSATIDVIPIGLHRVSNFVIEDLEILNAHSYNVALFTTNDGVVENLNIDVDRARPVSTDGISIQNSQDIRVTRNLIYSGDDAIVVWASYQDQRAYQHPDGGDIWWSTDDPQPTRNIEIDNNTVLSEQRLAFVPWGTHAPDQSMVTISDVRVHDNILQGVSCWCDNPDNGDTMWSYSDKTGDQSAVTNVRFQNNVYRQSAGAMVATDAKSDYGLVSSPELLNGDFEDGRSSWWTTVGDAGAVSAADDHVLKHRQARQALASMAGTAGYIQDFRRGSAIYQGISAKVLQALGPADYRVSADVVTSGHPVRLFAYDTCTEETLAEQTVQNTARQRVDLDFQITSTCDDIQVGIDQGSSSAGWALIDEVAVTGTSHIFDSVELHVGEEFAAAAWNGAMESGLGAEYTVTVDVNTNGEPATLSVFDDCTESALVEQSVQSSSLETFELTFETDGLCGLAHVAVDHGELGEASVRRESPTVIDDDDPQLTYSGSWGTFPNSGTWGGTDAVGLAAGASVTIPFTGSRAVVIAVKDKNLGMMDVYLDGELMQTVDLYASGKTAGQAVYDTGDLTPGEHTLRIVTTGEQAEQSTGFVTDWDAVFVR